MHGGRWLESIKKKSKIGQNETAKLMHTYCSTFLCQRRAGDHQKCDQQWGKYVSVTECHHLEMCSAASKGGTPLPIYPNNIFVLSNSLIKCSRFVFTTLTVGLCQGARAILKIPAILFNYPSLMNLQLLN